jgi:hypothetical protein
MKAVPLTQRQAAEYVEKNHRHHKPARGDVFRIGAELNGCLVGVIQCGRPSARGLQDGTTLEATRLCTDGTENACSFLYAKAARVAKELGYKRIYTYILDSETGTSLKASGWKFDGMTAGGSWNCPSRPRTDKAPICAKQRWVKILE